MKKRVGTEGRRRRGKVLLASCLISEDDTTAGAPLGVLHDDKPKQRAGQGKVCGSNGGCAWLVCQRRAHSHAAPSTRNMMMS